MVDTGLEIAGAMEIPAHGATAGGEHKLDLGDLIDFHSEIPVLQSSPDLLTWSNIQPALPLTPPLSGLFPFSIPSPLDPVSLSAHHLWHGIVAGLPNSSSIGVKSGGSQDSGGSHDSAFSL